MAKKRIRKRQLKQDKFIRTTFEFTDWIRENQRTVIYAALGVILTAVIVSSLMSYRRKETDRALNSFYQAMQAYRSGNYALAASDLESIYSDEGGGSITDQVLYYLANAHYQLGDYDAARRTLEQFQEEIGTGSPMSHQAYALLAATLEQQGEKQKAADAYVEAASISRFPYQEKENRLNAARLYRELGEYDRAIEQYDILIDKLSGTDIDPAELDEIRMQRAEVRSLAEGGEERM
jgi:tetratricopeptide (TPR) repeat protein